MIGRPIQRIASWLCLALMFVTGVVPARGMVLCLEPDGCVSIELKAATSACEGCDEHLDEQAPVSEPVDEHDGVCPCVDLDLPGAKETPRPRGLAFEPLDLPVVVHEIVRDPAPAAVTHARSAIRLERPRPPDTLRAIRTVVLLR